MLRLAVGERTEISLNIRTDDGMINGAGNVIKLIQMHNTDKPSGVIWVHFDHTDVGLRTRQDKDSYICKVLNLHGLQSNLSLHSLL